MGIVRSARQKEEDAAERQRVAREKESLDAEAKKTTRKPKTVIGKESIGDYSPHLKMGASTNHR